MAIDNTYNAKVSAKNEDFANRIRNLSNKYSIVGILDVTGLPAPQFQRMRASLRKTAEILIVKKNLIQIVLKELESTHKGITGLLENANGIVGLVFTNDNPFTLFKFVKKNKSSAPAKAGAIAPNDIIVPAGPTSFAPGPIIGELGALKIKAGINAGKVEIKADSIVAKEGEVISAALAGVLTRLGIEPLEVGLNLKAIFEEGTVYGKSVLDVDEEAIIADIKAQAAACHSLAIGLGYFVKENVSHFLGKGGKDSLALGVGTAYPAAETLSELLTKAAAEAAGLMSGSAADAVAGANAPANEEPKKEEKAPAPAADMGSFF